MFNVDSASMLYLGDLSKCRRGFGPARRNRLTVSDYARGTWRGELTAAVKGRYGFADAQAKHEIEGSWSYLGRGLVGSR